MYTHAFLSWLVANLLHPLMVLIIHDNWNIAALILLEGFPLSCLVSLPSLAMCMMLMYVLGKIHIDTGSKLVIWSLGTAAMPAINALLFLLVFIKDGFRTRDLEMAAPATAAVLITLLIWAPHFFRVFPESSDNNEKKGVTTAGS